MKKYRRIEITAFRRRVVIISGGPKAEAIETEVRVNGLDSQRLIETESCEGQQFLTKAIRILEESLHSEMPDN